MQNKYDALPLFAKQILMFSRWLKNPEAVAKLKMPIWGSGRLIFVPREPHYIAVGNYKVNWCAAWELKGVSIEFTSYEAPFSQTKTTAEHLYRAIDHIQDFHKVLKLFGVEDGLEWAGLYLHEWDQAIFPAKNGGAPTAEAN